MVHDADVALEITKQAPAGAKVIEHYFNRASDVHGTGDGCSEPEHGADGAPTFGSKRAANHEIRPASRNYAVRCYCAERDGGGQCDATTDEHQCEGCRHAGRAHNPDHPDEEDHAEDVLDAGEVDAR